MTISTRLKELRLEMGINLTELSSLAGVSRTYLSEIENGHNTNIGLNVAIALADVFGVTLDHLVGREVAS